MLFAGIQTGSTVHVVDAARAEGLGSLELKPAVIEQLKALSLAASRQAPLAAAAAAAAGDSKATDDSDDEDEEVDDPGHTGVLPLFSDALPFDMYIVEAGPGLKERKALHVKSVDNKSPAFSADSDGADPKLFANRVWNGARCMADHLCEHHALSTGKTVVELGAASALPSLVTATLGAKAVVVTDYPEECILSNIRNLVKRNGFRPGVGFELEEGEEEGKGDAAAAAEQSQDQQAVHVLGHRWGDDASPLVAANGGERFDLALLAETFWADTYEQHQNLLSSVDQLLADDGIALVGFCHHDTPPDSTVVHTMEHDLEFFARAAAPPFAFEATRLLAEETNAMCCVGLDAEKTTVYLYQLKRKKA
eukprot:g1948.t1